MKIQHLLPPALALVLLLSANGPTDPPGTPKSTGIIDLSDLPDYAGQPVPAYILKDNTPADNPITDAGATLGRVLFYDTQLSVDNTVSCASCHRREFAFSDTAVASVGVNGTTGRHAMRLVNARFAQEERFFWDERADSLEMQTTMPVQDHAEMGFSGTQGDPDIDSLITRLSGIGYYAPLFTAAFGDDLVTEERMQRAMSQFIRSIQSFDAKYDVGRAQVANDGQPFPNFTPQENAGKNLFLAPPLFDPQGFRVGGGAGCQGCHRAPEFDIDPASLNNGFFGSIDGSIDLTNTRAPSLRDVVGPGGASNGPFFHHGNQTTLQGVIGHYDNMPAITLQQNPLIDPRLTPGGNLQRLQLTPQEVNELVAFLRTLTGTELYTDEKWSDPFLNGQLTVIGGTTAVQEVDAAPGFSLYPNPVSGTLFLELDQDLRNAPFAVHDATGRVVLQGQAGPTLDVSALPRGTYLLRVNTVVRRFVKE